MLPPPSLPPSLLSTSTLTRSLPAACLPPPSRYTDESHPDLNKWPDATWQRDRDQTNLDVLPESLDQAHVKERLRARWRDTHGGSAQFTSAKQRAFYSLLSTYADVFLPAQPYPK